MITWNVLYELAKPPITKELMQASPYVFRIKHWNIPLGQLSTKPSKLAPLINVDYSVSWEWRAIARLVAIPPGRDVAWRFPTIGPYLVAI